MRMKESIRNGVLKAGKVIVSFAWVAVIFSANVTCAFCTYEEKAPEDLKRFSRVK